MRHDTPRHRQDNRHDSAVSVIEAARRLGVTPDAVRKRFMRGKIDGYRVDGTLYIVLPKSGPGLAENATDATPDRTELVDELRDRIVALERRLDEASAEKQRLEELLLYHQHNLTATLQQLLPPAREERRRPWWRFWS